MRLSPRWCPHLSRWLFVALLIAVATAALSAITLPRINPDPSFSTPTPLEQLGAFGIIGLGVLVRLIAAEPLPIYAAISHRHLAAVRARRLAAAVSVVLLAATVVAVLLPPDVDRQFVTAQLALMAGIALAVSPWLPQLFAVAAPFILALAMGLRVAWPWSANIMFNIATKPVLMVLGPAVFLAGSALWVWLGEYEQRRLLN